MTRADLDELRELLGDETLWAAPPAALEDDIVAAIAAEAAELRSRRRAAAAPAAPPPPPMAGARDLARRPSRPSVPRRPRGGRGRRRARRRRRFVVDPQSRRHGTAVALEADTIPGRGGTAHVSGPTPGGASMLDATGLPRRDDGEFYEAWLRTPTASSCRSARSTRAPT